MIGEDIAYPHLERIDYYYSIARFIFIIIAVIALGLFIINSIMSYRYKVEFVKTPCSLCAELNKNQSKCIEGCFTITKKLYPSVNGDWVDDLGDCYDFSGRQITCREGSQKKNIVYNRSNLANYIIPTP